MQKKLIALAVAGLASSAAFADNVSMYGTLDAAFIGTSGSNLRSATSVIAGGLATSRIGFNVSEDLGNGTKVIANLEYALDNEQNQGIGTPGANAIVGSATQARQQLLGLTGSWGTFATGRLQTAAYDFASKFDVTAGSAVSPLQNMVNGSGLVIGTTGAAARANSALAYISPNMSGFTVAVNYAYLNQFNVANTSTAHTNDTATLLAANYDNGPLAVGAVWSRIKADSVGTGAATALESGLGASDTWNEWALGASYNFGVATVKATYQNGHCSGSNCGTTNSVKAWSLGGVIPAGPGAVAISYARVADDRAANIDASSYTLGYLYPMSKRTTAYVAYNHASQDSGAGGANATGYSVDNSLLGGVVSAGGSSNLWAVGLNHKF